MAVDDDYVTVQKSQLDCFRQHCERYPYFSEQLRDLSDGRAVVIPQGRPSGEPSKKRKTLHDLRHQEVSPSHLSQPESQLPSQSSQQPEPPLPLQPSQEPGSQLSSGSSNGSKVKKPKTTHTNGPRKRPQQKPRKNEAANWFLRNAPKATEWRKRQTELGLNTVEQYEQAIRAFRDRPNIIVERKTYQGDGYSESELVELAERFALLTGHSLMNAKLQKAFATFQALILLSYCEVLRKRGVPQDTLDPIIQHIGGRERDRRTLLASALWLNGVIVALVSHGWTIYRATELFFIDALSITYLIRIHNNRNSQLILEHLKTDEFVKHDYSDCLRPEYTIPGIIASLLDASNIITNKPSIDGICAALGYKSDCIPTSAEGIYKVHAASKSTLVTSLDLDFEVLVPSSFQSNDGPLTSASNSYSTKRASDRRRLYTEGNGQQSMTVASVAPGGGAVVEPQNQVGAFNQPSPRSHDRLQDGNWSPANEAILNAAGSRPLIHEDGTHAIDGTALITEPARNLIVSSTQPKTFPDTETLPIVRNCGTSVIALGGGEVRDNSGQDEQAFNPQRPEVLANNPRSNGAVCFKQHLAQPVVNPMVAPSTVVSGPEEHGVEADSISAMRMCKWTNLNPQPVLRLAQDGLIKIKSSSFSGSAGTLHDFYVHSICAGRTLLKDNAYLHEVLLIADNDTATKYAMIALTSSYYKEYLPDGSAQKERMKKWEVEAMTRAMAALKRDAVEGLVFSGDTAKMLLIHHAILNQNLHSAHWTNYLYQLQDFPGQQSNLIMARHSIWLMTILPLNEKYRFQTFNYDWVGCGEDNSSTKVNGILGTSRKMLYFEYLVTVAAKFPKTVDHGNLLRDIEESCQWVDVTEVETATRIALKTAETYKLATKLYALARLCRLTPRHAGVREICNRLTRELYELPASGEEYSGLHPAWCFPIACACTEDPEEYAKMDRILERIGNVNKSNVSDLSRLVRLIWKWKNGRHLSEGWWEDMTEYLDSVMDGNLICVS